MRIGIDSASLNNKDGTGTYASNLCKYLQNNPEIELFYFSENLVQQAQFSRKIIRIIKKLIRISTRTYFDPFFEWCILPKQLARSSIDIYHSTGSIVPLNASCITVQTCLDLAFYYNNDYLPESLVRYYKKWFKASTRKATHVIAISESTKRDLIKIWKIPEKKISVIHLGVNNNLYSTRVLSKENFQKTVGIFTEYILFVGNLNPRKNALRLVKAFLKISMCYPELKLVIVGSMGQEEKSIRNLTNQPNVRDKVIITGRVSEKLLVAYYQNSQAFCYPSLYEGFGLPILEAMAAGTPVLTSNTSSMPEIAGDAAILVDPYDISSISNGIISVLKTREALINKGHKRVEAFTWQKTANKTTELYNRLIKES